MNGDLYDVVIIGGGPAGLTAALYLARARYRVLVVEKEQFGGQITITADVVNYPGVERDSGEQITAVMRKQSQSFGAEFLMAEVQSLELSADEKTVRTTRGVYRTFGIILATGAHPRTIGFAGEQEFQGRGVAYCATCDGEFFTGKDIFVVGGGFAAAEEAVFLTKYARHVTVLVREEDFTCAKATADPVKSHPNITVLYNTVVESVSGDTSLQEICYKNIATGEEQKYHPPEGETFGVFVFAGYEPETKLVQGLIALNSHGYILCDRNQKTDVEGVYAAGDVCAKNLRQMVTATADGAIAATELERYASELQKKTGIVPQPPTNRAAQAEQLSEKAEDEEFFTPEIRGQLEGVFQKMESPLVLRVHKDDHPVSAELVEMLQEMAGWTDRLTVETVSGGLIPEELPSVNIHRSNGEDMGIAFHGIPGGHEFNSFVLGLYNAAGPGQSLEGELLEKIRAIHVPVSIKIFVSLSCTKCPELVMAAQRIAVENPLIRAEAYDLNHFPALRDRYQIMSVPCLQINDGAFSFGKKNVTQLLEMITATVNTEMA